MLVTEARANESRTKRPMAILYFMVAYVADVSWMKTCMYIRTHCDIIKTLELFFLIDSLTRAALGGVNITPSQTLAITHEPRKLSTRNFQYLLLH